MFGSRVGRTALAALVVCATALAVGSALWTGEGEAQGSPAQGGGLKITSKPGQPMTEAEKNQVLAVIVAATKADPKKVHLMGARLTAGDREAPTQNGVTAVVHNYATHKATRYVIEIATGKIVQQQVQAGHATPGKSEFEEAKKIVQADPKVAPLLKDGDLEGGFLVSHHAVAKDTQDKHRLLQLQLLKKGNHDVLLRSIIVDMTERKVFKVVSPN